MKKLLELIIDLFKGKDYKTLRREIIKIVNVIKNAVESKEAQYIVDFTKTKVDDKLLAWLKISLPFLLKRLNLTDDTITMQTSVREAVKSLKQVKKKDRGTYYQAIASNLYADKVKINPEMAQIEIETEYKLMNP
jgi:uncharacterized membrane protein YukC